MIFIPSGLTVETIPATASCQLKTSILSQFEGPKSTGRTWAQWAVGSSCSSRSDEEAAGARLPDGTERPPTDEAKRRVVAGCTAFINRKTKRHSLPSRVPRPSCCKQMTFRKRGPCHHQDFHVRQSHLVTGRRRGRGSLLERTSGGNLCRSTPRRTSAQCHAPGSVRQALHRGGALTFLLIEMMAFRPRTCSQ